MRSLNILLVFLLIGCANESVSNRYAIALQTRHQNRMEYVAVQKAAIKRMPIEQRQAAYEKLIREIDNWRAEDQRQDAIQAQENLTDSINGLSDEVRQARLGY